MRTQILALSIGRLYGAAIQAVVVIVTARLVTVDDFGRLGTVLSIGLFAVAMGDLGISTLLAKAQALGNLRLVASCVLLNRVSSAAMGLVLIGVVAASGSATALTLALTFVAAALAVEKNTDTLLAIPIADNDKLSPAMSIVVRRTVTIGIFFGLLSFGLPAVSAYGFSYLIGSLAGQIHVMVVLRSARYRSVHRGSTSATLRTSIPYFISNLTTQARLLDVSIVGAVAGIASAGLYSAATRITNPFTLIAGVVTTVTMPHAAKRSRPDRLVLARKLSLASGLSLLLVIPFTFFMPELIHFILGPRYVDAAAALAWSFIALPAIFLSSPLGSVLQAGGDERFVALNGTVFASLTLVLIALGASLAGASGAAIAVAVTYSSKCLALWIRLIVLQRKTLVRTSSLSTPDGS